MSGREGERGERERKDRGMEEKGWRRMEEERRKKVG